MDSTSTKLRRSRECGERRPGTTWADPVPGGLRILLLAAFLTAISPSVSVAAAHNSSGASPTGAPTSASPVPSSIPPHEGRFFFRLGAQGLAFGSHLDDRITPTSPDYRYRKRGSGPTFALGYDFGPRFGFEVDFGVALLDSEPAESKASLVTVGILGVVPVAAHGPLRASVAAGLGFGFLYHDGPDFPERAYAGMSGNLGLRLRCRALRHLRLVAGTDYAIHDVAWEWVPSNPADDDIRDVGGTLWVRSAFAGIEFH